MQVGAIGANGRLDAARAFAQTMIVIDDQASQQPVEEAVSGGLAKPGRAASRAAGGAADRVGLQDVQHGLDAKALIESAMDHGLICSVLRPASAEEDITERVVKAAERVDIVSLDWEMFADGGRTAREIVKRIVVADAEAKGRLRLIAVYTGDRRRGEILGSIADCFDEAEREKLSIQLNEDAVVGAGGLRIVCLFKAHGTRVLGDEARDQIVEKDLPERLLQEFARLSEGLLSNVALGVIASVRAAAHHLVAKFNGRMDGPYFHHRAMIENPDDAEDYAIGIVLSEMKNLVDKEDVGSRWAGDAAVGQRIDEIAGGIEMHLKCKGKDGSVVSHVVPTDNVKQTVIRGCKDYPLQFADGSPPGRAAWSAALSSLFVADYNASVNDMLEFASLTGVRAHPGSRAFSGPRQALPFLRLGSVVSDRGGRYWLCLQAVCDAVRIRGETPFFFAPLVERNEKPQHVVPVLQDGKVKHVGLDLADKAYTKTISWHFEPTEGDESGRVWAVRSEDGKLSFVCTDGSVLTWVADLKQRRAQRIAHQLSMEMTRVGFDEFEPFRGK